MTTPGPLTPGHTWQTLLARTSFIELDALGRATALADKDQCACTVRSIGWNPRGSNLGV